MILGYLTSHGSDTPSIDIVIQKSTVVKSRISQISRINFVT
jgi:hypothetical protein